MSNTYIIFERIAVQNANCVAGFTYGFPAITHFLGFGHALSRKLSQTEPLQLQGCAVICHEHQLHAYPHKDKYVFTQSKNPPKDKTGKTPPIIEEGKVNMTVSLVMECPNFRYSRRDQIEAFKNTLKLLANCHHLAGGIVLSIKSIQIWNESKELLQNLKRLLLPGFVLMDRSDLLSEHYQALQQEQSGASLLDAWLDFAALKHRAEPKLKAEEHQPTEKTEAEWVITGKPGTGWLVPITNGYKAISALYSPHEVANSRNPEYPSRFVEAIHSIGEWCSLHRIKQINPIVWRYHYEEGWYLCKQSGEAANEAAETQRKLPTSYPEDDDFLNNLA